MAIPPDILRIASMLDDADENVGVNLLAQLLERADELGDLPALLQESGDPVVRRRAHQLQSALTMRRRRREFHRRLTEDANPDLPAGLEELHLLWFDRDSAAALHTAVTEFAADFRSGGTASLEEVEFFLRRRNFLPEPESTIVPESYCLGTILDRRAGAGSVLLALAAELADGAGLRVVRTLDEFGLVDGRGGILLGGGAWRLCPAPDIKALEFWNSRMILRYVAATLLSCAVNSDSYRYVMSIAQALGGDDSEHVFDRFPYPFRATAPEHENVD